jgi:hypothetical protein
LRIAAGTILVCLLIGASGCMCRQNFGELSDDSSMRATLLNGSKPPEVSEVSFRTVIRWGGREISLVEVVKAFPEGNFSVAGVTDIGKTLYSVQIDSQGKGHVISKVLPVSDKWLLENLVTELLIPWKGPDETFQLYKQPDGKWALVNEAENTAKVFIFDETDNWLEFHRISDCRLRCKESFKWGQRHVPKMMRVENFDKHYNVVRESVSVVP